MNFSVLLSVYGKENPLFFREALESLVVQTLLPDEIVVVKDGPLPDKLEDVLSTFRENGKVPVTVVPLEENAGLGEALRIGLLYCKHPYVARMDSDDLSLPHRFETQMEYLKKHDQVDLVGSWITEFDGKGESRTRLVPEGHENIKKRARHRNPLNHVSVVFRKEAVVRSGSYQPCLWNEDYYLWMRMLGEGCRLENLPVPLLKVRTGEEMYKRRGGSRYVRNEVRFQRRILREGYITYGDFLFNVMGRSLVRILPNTMRSMVYTRFLRKKTV